MPIDVIQLEKIKEKLTTAFDNFWNAQSSQSNSTVNSQLNLFLLNKLTTYFEQVTFIHAECNKYASKVAVLDDKLKALEIIRYGKNHRRGLHWGALERYERVERWVFEWNINSLTINHLSPQGKSWIAAIKKIDEEIQTIDDSLDKLREEKNMLELSLMDTIGVFQIQTKTFQSACIDALNDTFKTIQETYSLNQCSLFGLSGSKSCNKMYEQTKEILDISIQEIKEMIEIASGGLCSSTSYAVYDNRNLIRP